MSHQATRKHKIHWIMNRIGEACATGKALKKDELISLTCLEFGAGERYVKEILKHLELGKFIIIEFSDVFTKQHYEALKIYEKEDLLNDKILEDIKP